MGKFNVAAIAKGIRSTVVKRSPEILVGLGVSGMIGSIIFAVKATPRAMSLVEEKAHEEHCEPKDLTTAEKVKACWKCYIPTAVMSVTSAACVIGAHSVNARRNAALAAAYTLSDSALREYQEKVVEVIGEKKEQVVRDEIAKDKVNKNPVSGSEVIVTRRGDTLCYDVFSGRYFKSDIDAIKKAVNELNREMIDSMYVSLNDLYDKLDLGHTKLGDDLGWRVEDGLLEIDFSAQVADDGRPCLVLDYNISPNHNYWSTR